VLSSFRTPPFLGCVASVEGDSKSGISHPVCKIRRSSIPLLARLVRTPCEGQPSPADTLACSYTTLRHCDGYRPGTAGHPFRCLCRRLSPQYTPSAAIARTRGRVSSSLLFGVPARPRNRDTGEPEYPFSRPHRRGNERGLSWRCAASTAINERARSARARTKNSCAQKRGNGE
jgi:hypothetical protein